MSQPLSQTLQVLLDRFDGRLTLRVAEVGAVIGMIPQSAHNSANLGRFPIPVIRQKGIRPFCKTIDLANYLDCATPKRRVGRPTKREQVSHVRG